MKVINVRNEDSNLDLVLNVRSTWDEFKMVDYLEFEKAQNDDDVLQFIKMLSVCSGVEEDLLSEIPIKEFNKFDNLFSDLGKLEAPVVNKWEDQDILYVCKKDMSNLTVSELIAIKSIEKNEKNDFEVKMKTLAVLLRPGYKKIEEDGTERYLQNKLDVSEIETRKNIFIDRLPAVIGIPILRAFIFGATE